MAKSALRDQILNAKDIKSETVAVPEWGGEFTIRGLTGAQQQAASDAATVKEKGPDGEDVSRVDGSKLAVEMLLRSLIDPETNAAILEPADADALMQKSANVLNRLAAVAMKLNGMTKDEDAAIEKNSDATATGAGASA